MAKQKVPPSPELKAVLVLLEEFRKCDAILVWDGTHVKTVKKIRLGHGGDGVARAIILDL